LTKAATGVVGSLIGDGIAQYAESRSKPRGAVGYDAGRASRLCAYAAVIGSPVGHYWFHFLDKFIFPNAMAHPMTAVVKTLLDQVLMAPAGIALFFSAMSVLEGNSVQEAWQSTKEKFKPTLMANYVLWPAANLINFAFVPPAQRILYCNVVYIFWASFLSAMASKKGEVQYDAALAQKEL
jgi:protein Mpv17